MEFNRLIPELYVSDLEASLKFYVETLGFKLEYQREESKFVFLSLQGSQLMLEERGLQEVSGDQWETGPMKRPFGRGINFQVFVHRIVPLLDALSKSRYSLMKGPWESWYRKDQAWVGQNQFLIQDPDGYLFRFAEILPSR